MDFYTVITDTRDFNTFLKQPECNGNNLKLKKSKTKKKLKISDVYSCSDSSGCTDEDLNVINYSVIIKVLRN